jgi:thiol-disulfide isomerase/thioredoxin
MLHPHWGIAAALLVGLGLTAGCDAWSLADTRAGQPAPPSSEEAPPPQGLQFVRGYLQGYEEAREAGRPMFVLFTAPGCNYCEQMIAEASEDPQVVQLSRRFVCILVEADAEPEICREFRVRAYPTVQFMSPEGVPLNRVMGRTPAHQLALQMQAALQATASRLEHARQTRLR